MELFYLICYFKNFGFLNVSKEVILPSKNGPQISQPYSKTGIIIEENSFTITLIGTFYSTWDGICHVSLNYCNCFNSTI
jgi:hypothetical protein